MDNFKIMKTIRAQSERAQKQNTCMFFADVVK